MAWFMLFAQARPLERNLLIYKGLLHNATMGQFASPLPKCPSKIFNRLGNYGAKRPTRGYIRLKRSDSNLLILLGVVDKLSLVCILLYLASRMTQQATNKEAEHERA